MKARPLPLPITLAEATIGVFVKLTVGLIPIHTLTFYASPRWTRAATPRADTMAAT